VSLEDNKAFVTAVLDAAFNRGDLDVVDRHFSADAAIHDPGLEMGGPADLRRGLAGLRTVFPDFHFSIEDVLAERDRVAIRYRGSGTHCADFLGVSPSGRWVDYTGIVILRLEQGKIAEFWAQPDQLGVLKQIQGA
jgi:steroid delta-isomerase-like uncharacterized protein